MDSPQEQARVRETTMNRDWQNSPTGLSARGMGRKANIVVRDAANRGSQSSETAPVTALIRSSPEVSLTRIASETTTPLSTRIPREMINDAMETRCNPTPKYGMRAMQASMAMGTSDPAISPVRNPAKARMTMTTKAKDSNRLIMKSVMAVFT